METKDIVKTAGAMLSKASGLSIRQLVNDAHVVAEYDEQTESDCVVEIQRGKYKELFFTDVRNELRAINLPKILDKFAKGKYGYNKQSRLLICQYIPAPIKAELKKQQINYLEASGNCFIQRDNFFLYISDQKVTQARVTDKNKVWNATGIKFILALLTDKDLLALPYRSIAAKAGVALGNIGTFITELKKEGFLEEGQKKNMFLLNNKKELINRWVELYATILRPRLRIGTYRCAPHQNWENNWQQILETVNKKEGNIIFVGGEPAGSELTGQLVPEQFILYTNRPEIEIIKLLKLIPDPTGNIELLEAFWHDELNTAHAKRGIAPELVVYADLLASMDSRNTEIAALLVN